MQFNLLGVVLSMMMLASGDLPSVPASQQADDKGAKKLDERVDLHTLSNPAEFLVSHLDLDLTVDFEHREIKGIAVLELRRRPECPRDAPLALDTRDLTIESVAVRDGDVPGVAPFRIARFELGPPDPILGSRLSIDVPKSATQVRIVYTTAPGATALQWLQPALTAGKKQPFLFTQSQAIHARSWIPLQDSPGVRITLSAVIRTPPGLTAVMAAASHVKDDESKNGVFRFAMPESIPSYLIALAVGDLAFQPLGPRTGVWAEPSLLKTAAFEFADIEKMLTSIEKRYGPYRWGRYDILVLPPSFPYGGMENPRLTFATPTILAGDRSLVSLVAHELAHSWAGNLVTNATWRDFWLNEGVTTYCERRIIEDIYGLDRAAMESVLGLRELRRELKEKPERDQVLHIDLAGRDPDEGAIQIPYEKGALFLRTLEAAFGRERFDVFLRSYFDRFAFKSITTGDFVGYLNDHLLLGDPIAKTIDLDSWLNAPGLPTNFAEPKSERLAEIDREARGWSDGSIETQFLRAATWSTQEWLRFIQALPEKLPRDRMAELDHAFKLTQSGNAEIAHQWLLLAVKSDYAPAAGRLEAYLISIGRRKLIVPLYGALIATPEGRNRAQAIFAKAKPGYHPITVEAVEKLLREHS
jgi:aminopeptidase N